MTFHNTINLTGKDLGEAIRSCASQEAAILAVLDSGIARTPSQLHRMFCALGKRWPVTSVRRGLSNLTKAGLAVKLDETRKGSYHLPEHYWTRAGAAQ